MVIMLFSTDTKFPTNSKRLQVPLGMFPKFPTKKKLSVCDEDHPCQGLGRHASFANFGIAWLTLFRVSTGDNWNGIMKVNFNTETKFQKFS